MKFSPYITELLQQKARRELRLSSDCEYLALDIETVTGEHIGVNTLKRLLGFIDDEREPRLSTLDIIARYLNFNNWDERLRSLMEVMYKDKLFYMNTIKHAGSYIIQYMLNDTEMIITKAIDTIDQNSIVCDTERHFLSRFLSYGICGILTEWVTEGMQTDPKEMSAYMLKMLKHCENAAYDFKTGKLDI